MWSRLGGVLSLNVINWLLKAIEKLHYRLVQGGNVDEAPIFTKGICATKSSKLDRFYLI